MKPQWRHHHRQYHRWHPVARQHRHRVYARAAAATAPEPDQGFNLFGFHFYTPTASLAGDARLLHVAERYVGHGNFTGFNGKWCAAAAGLWLKEAGYSRLGSLAAVDYARYGRASAPKVGAVAVLPHHIGIVAKVYPYINPAVVGQPPPQCRLRHGVDPPHRRLPPTSLNRETQT